MKSRAALPKPPPHLRRPGRELWAAILRDHVVDDGAGAALLTAACEARDRSEAAREEIAKDGMTWRDSKGGLRPHPLLATERDSRAACVSAIRALGLDVGVQAELGRPVDGGGRVGGGGKGAFKLLRLES